MCFILLCWQISTIDRNGYTEALEKKTKSVYHKPVISNISNVGVSVGRCVGGIVGANDGCEGCDVGEWVGAVGNGDVRKLDSNSL